MIKVISFCFLLFGILMLFNYRLDKTIVLDIKSLLEKHIKISSSKVKTKSLKAYVLETEGKKKDNPFRKASADAQLALENIGQKNRFRKTQILAYITAAVAFVASFVFMQNILISSVLAAGFYFLPLWCTRFYVYKYTREVNEELSVALSMITTSYIRTSDIQSAIAENVEHTSGVVKVAFTAFLNYLKINPSMTQTLTHLRNDIDSPLFRQWVDTLILCQEDHALRFALTPTVQKFSTLKMLQMENETKMTMPLKYSVLIVGIAVLFIPGIGMLMPDWYHSLTTTLFGQISIAITLISSLFTLNNSIKLSGPIEFSI